ncbi:D-2-hydroxyacid dehydrogenase [Chrysiogenes arsenatis]|uniref:D-2-hydroxyacid dehydrogenase n=1 Tax=Chrysiogenes arsenatis TaxID=309797 RepID=UPI000405038F|nr:D-2-hydroxyacid dehydrogenase [Chrysiogenes arsenatis]
MNIVVLDGYTMNPGDLDWSLLERLGNCTIHHRTEADKIVAHAQGAEIVLTNKTPLSAQTIAALPKLQYIGVLATGVNVVDLAAARERGIVVTNAPGYSTASVVQMMFALLLEMTQQVGHHAERVRNGAWCQCADFSFHERPLLELAGKTLGIVGFGQIGQQVARVATAFGMRVLVSTAHPEKYQAESIFTFTSLDEVFAHSDVVSLNCPLTEQTNNMVNGKRLLTMKTGALLVNTGRGQLIDDVAVAQALHDGHLGGYASDVMSQEPPRAENPLLSAPRCFLTPHIAWATAEARQRLLVIVVENIQAFLQGTPCHRVA